MSCRAFTRKVVFQRGLARHMTVVTAALLSVLTFTLPVFADEGHAGHGGASTALAAFTSGPVIWGAASLAGILVVLILSRLLLLHRLTAPVATHDAQMGYLMAIRQFSRNARFFLTYALLSELGSGIWSVMFNLYLLRMDFPIAFIGTFWLINMLCHGAASLPIGLLADRFGRRAAFFLATGLSVVAQAGVLFTQHPALILTLGGIAGFGQAAHGVTGAPFMMENSERRERPFLFSLNACFLQFSRFGGSMAGGLLPLVWATLLGVPAVAPEAARWALVTGLPLTIMGAIPLVFIRERAVERARSLKDVIALRNVVSFPIIVRLTLLSLIFGTAFGLTIRFFNLFFEQAHGASDSQIGAILALGSLAGASAILISPVLAHGWGKAPGILLTQTLSIPFLLLMALVPSLTVVTMLFLVRGTIYSIAMPLREQLAMELIAPQERGTTAGLTHTTFDLGGGLGAGLAALLITGNGFVAPFTVAAVLILIPAVLYYVFFARLEMRQEVGAMVPAAATSSIS